jgi:NADPH:quinone reductase-like Zn-dependent oxidoreductase
MVGLDLLPGFKVPLGLELSGVGAEVGPGVAEALPNLRPGARVAAVLLDVLSGAPDAAAAASAARPGAAGLVAVPAALCVPLPPDGGGGDAPLAEAAGYLVGQLTAHYALLERARLAPQDTLLIHSALGGLGQAALRVAQRVGCRVIASAGSAAKRERLSREQGVVAVLDSRAPPASWGPAVAAATGGRGVSVVLNSLSGAGLVGSLALVAPCGRFVEVGKRDILGGTPLDLSLLKRNITFISAHVDMLVEDDAETLVRVSEE